MNPNVSNIKQMPFIRTAVVALAAGVLIAGMFVTTLQADEANAPDKSPTGGSLTEAQKLAASDPKKDFATAKQKGDIHFLAVMGFAKEVLGVEGANKVYLNRVPVKVVEGTTDYHRTEQDHATQEKVRKYTLVYNTLVLEFLKEQDKHSK